MTSNNVSWKYGLIIETPDNWSHIFSKCDDEFQVVKQKLTNCINENPDKKVLPPQGLIFNAFYKCPPNELKVVLLGQDPYYAKENQAMGMSFSVSPGIRNPKSLNMIFRAIYNNIGNTFPENGDLTRWAEQGVLLLNTSLTVFQGNPNSHQKIWANYTDCIINQISEQYDNIIFILWGNFAKSKKKFVNCNKHIVLEWSHPAARDNSFVNCPHFSIVNNHLESMDKTPINW
jgi:uracil-DNA glycosylase